MTSIGEAARHQTLASLLGSFPVDEFLRTIMGQNYLHIKSPVRERFEYLFDWSALNGILERQRLEPPRIRLSKDSRNIPASAFITSFNDSRGARISRIRPEDVRQQIEEGATLVIDAVDELHGPLSQLAFGLEQGFRESVHINAYLGAQGQPGFETHWDTHDVLVLQVYGRKRWTVYGMGRKYALAGDAQYAKDVPQPPAWTGVLEPGDVLYLPRAWWHDACSTGEPTLHLTVGIHTPSGLDFVQWLASKLRDHEIVRRDLPRFAAAPAREEHLGELRKAISETLQQHDFDGFYCEHDGERQSRSHSSLPWTLAPDLFPLAQSQRVRFAFPGAPRFKKDNCQTKLQASGREWNLSDEMARLIDELADGDWYTVAELQERSAGYLDPSVASVLISELLRQGLFELER